MKNKCRFIFNIKLIKKTLFIIHSVFFILHINNNVLAIETDIFGENLGKMVYNEQENKIYYKKSGTVIDNNNYNDCDGNYHAKHDSIQYLLNKSIQQNRYNSDSKFNNIIANNLQKQIIADNKVELSLPEPLILYHDELSNKTNDSVLLNCEKIELSDGFIAVNMDFKNNVNIINSQAEIISKNGFSKLFSIFNINSNEQYNIYPNFLKTNKEITIRNSYILSEENKLKNMFIADNSNINFVPSDVSSTPETQQDERNIAIISSNDTFKESYAKAIGEKSNILVEKSNIIINNGSSGKAFFMAENSDISINTNYIDTNNQNNYGTITISGKDNTRKINGFAEGKNINIDTGVCTVFVDLIGSDSNFIKAKEIIDVTIKGRLKFNSTKANTFLNKSFVKSEKNATLTIGKLSFKNGVSLTSDQFLVEANGNATLNINENVTSEIANRILNMESFMLKGDESHFSGFKFNEEADITISDTKNIGPSLTIIGPLISVDGHNAKVTINNFNYSNYLCFDESIVETKDSGNVELTINNININNSDDIYIMNNIIKSAGDATLNINGIINNTNIGKIKSIFDQGNIESTGYTQINIKDLDLSDIDLSDKNKNIFNFKIITGKEIKINFEEIKTNEKTNIVSLININIGNKLSVNLEKDFYLNNAKISNFIKNNSTGDSNINFNFNTLGKKFELINTKISESLFISNGSGVELFNTHGSLNINKVSILSDNFGLINMSNETNNLEAKLGNSNGYIFIEQLNVDEDSKINTSIIYLKNNIKKHKTEIKPKLFSFKKSKIGAIVIDNSIYNNDYSIEIISNENLIITENKFLQSFVIGSKNSITIASTNNATDISKNTIHTGIITDKNITIGSTNSTVTIFSNNKASSVKNLNNYILKTESYGEINIIGKKIEIICNDTSDSRDLAYGLFETYNGNIKIGDNNTEKIKLYGNKTKDVVGINNTALMTTNSGNISFEAKDKISFSLKRINTPTDNKDNYSVALISKNGHISFKSDKIHIKGNSSIQDINISKLETFYSGNKLLLESTTSINQDYNGIIINDITLKKDNNIFFNFKNGIKMTSGNLNNKIFNLKSEKNNFNGAIFENKEDKIDLKLKNLNISSIDSTSSWLFRENYNKAEDIIFIDNIEIENSVKMAGFYYSKGKNFKINGYNTDADYINFSYKGEISGMTAIKFGTEEENANNIQYDANSFVMKVGDFKIKPITVNTNMVAGIVFTNQQYIETNYNGDIIKQNGNLKIEIKNDKTLDLSIPNKPSIAVIANKQNYDDGKNKKVFEFGETVIEGQAGGQSKVILSGYESLQTKNDNNFSDFEKIKSHNNTVGKSKLVIGENIKEFDTKDANSKFSLHEFEMKSGKIIVHLNQANKNRDLFQWVGDYKTLSNGESDRDKDIIEGKITFGANVTMDIYGTDLDGDFTLIKPGNFNIDIDNINNFLKKK